MLQKKLILTLIWFMSACTLFAGPFSSQWNWENQQVHGSVKEIETNSKNTKTVDYYNDKGQKTKEVMSSLDGEMWYTTKLNYNSNGDLYEVWFSMKGSETEAMYVETAIYKSKGIIDYIEVVRGGKTTRSKEIKYDANNNIEVITIEDGNRSMTWKMKFSKNKVLLESSILNGDTVRVLAKYKHDKYQNTTLVESFTKGEKGSESVISYLYDSKGNWTEKTTESKSLALNKSRTSKKIRSITYYK